MVYTDVYIDSDTKKPVVTLSQAVINESGSEYGVVALDVGLSQLATLISGEKTSSTDYSFMLDKDGRFLIHPTFAYNEELSKADTIQKINGGSLKTIGEKILSGDTAIEKGVFDGITKVYSAQLLKNVDFYVVSTMSEESFTQALKQLVAIVSIIMIASIVFFVVFGSLFIGRITRIIRNIADGMNKMATGDLTYKIPMVKRSDELGELTQSMNKMQNSVRDVIKAIVAETENVNRAALSTNTNITSLSDNLNHISESVGQLSAGMQQTAASSEEMNATSVEIGKVVENITEKAQEGAESASELNRRATDLRDNFLISQNSANEIFSNVKGRLEKALEESKAVEQIKILADSILQITSQTNLLALNAAIEAAKAGAAGAGFSVVAEEIRKLAEDSKNTVTQIQTITRQVTQSVQNLSASSESLLEFMTTNVRNDYDTMLSATEGYMKDAEKLDELVTDFSATAQELTATMDGMLMAINEITDAANEGSDETDNISHKTNDVTEKSAEIVQIAQDVKKSAGKLSEIVSIFKI